MAKKAKRKKKNGRPTRYRAEFVEQAYQLALLNLTDVQIADVLGVVEFTLNRWKLRYREFSESIKAGKVPADARVAQSLYNRATGCSVPEDKVFHNPTADKKEDRIVIVKGRKHYPPDTAAAFIWLKNRAGWKEKTEYVHHSDNLSVDECERLRGLLAEKHELKIVRSA